MIECTDDQFIFTEESFCSDFFDDQFTSVEVALAVHTEDKCDSGNDLTIVVLLFCSQSIFTIISIETAAGSRTSTSDKEVKVVKVSRRSSVGVKVRSKLFRPRNKGIDNNLAINSVHYKKDTKGGKYIFYAFPTYSASDALLFLPTAIASHMNSADVPSLSRLLMSHLDRDCACKLNLFQDEAINIRRFIQFHHIMIDLHPDSIMCVHNTRVVDNQLRASVYVKFTDCKTIYDSVAKSVTDPLFRALFGTHRAQSGLHGRAISDASGEVKNERSALVNSDEDLTVYVRLDMVLTIDDATRKVTEFILDGQVTSMKALRTIDSSTH